MSIIILNWAVDIRDNTTIKISSALIIYTINDGGKVGYNKYNQRDNDAVDWIT